MNQAFFIGRLAREVEMKEIGQGEVVVNNALAVSRKRRNRKGEVPVDFIPVVFWNRTAKVVDEYCVKGQRIAVNGSMRVRKYQDREGIDRYITECMVNEVVLLDRLYSSQSSKEESGAEVSSEEEKENIKVAVNMLQDK